MTINLKNRNFLKLLDYTPAEIQYLIDLAIELKAAKALAPEHEAQILGYLKSSRKGHGLLINFGSFKFQIRKFALRQGDNLHPQSTQEPQG